MAGTASADMCGLLGDSADEQSSSAERLHGLINQQLAHILRELRLRDMEVRTNAATTIVQEIYVRLIGTRSIGFRHRRRFFAAMGRVFRETFIDGVRLGGKLPVDSAVSLGSRTVTDDPGAVHAALQRLERIDRRKSAVVDLRFFVGMTTKQIASVLGIAEETVECDWDFARAWLHRELTTQQAGGNKQ